MLASKLACTSGWVFSPLNIINQRKVLNSWSTPQLPLESVNGRCHLCALMWTQMSSEHQDTLLVGDE
ncbi:hypothetical protein ABVK25_001138 [Lepraria finkii]|uniref:Uncharacterized protein n=1 Tax=Lepraria finkii TaxID=1340010 RepID=A0ABR4BL22_9LECA